MNLSQDELVKRFPNISKATLRRNAVQADTEDRAARPSTSYKKCPEGKPLVSPASGEEAGWAGYCKRFGIRFVVYAVRPADWDGWHVKELQDVLIEAGLIPDDSWKVIEEGSVATRKVHKAAEERTEIIITPL